MTDGNGLMYMRTRYYSPELLRFTSADILTGNVKNTQSLNRYAYCQGNPISFTDPFGMSPEIQKQKKSEKTMKIVHGGLDALGMVPVFGCVFDGTNMIIYTLEGDAVGAGLSAIAFIPAIGELSTPGKYGVKLIGATDDIIEIGAKYGDDAAELIWKSDDAFEFAYRNADDTLEALFKNSDAGGDLLHYSDDFTKTPFVPEEYWTRNAPNFNTPRSKIIDGTSYDINKLIKTQSYTYPDNISGIKETILKKGYKSVPPIEVRVHEGKALVVDVHHRLEAFRQLKYDRVPIKYIHGNQLGRFQKDGYTFYRSLDQLIDGIVK